MKTIGAKPHYLGILCIAASLIVIPVSSLASTNKTPTHRKNAASAPLPWYVTAGAIHRVMLRPKTKYWRFERLSLDSAQAASQLHAWKEEGMDVIDIYSPEEGGNSFGGLDSKDMFRLDPGVGTIAEFRRLVKEIHSLHMSVISSQNYGYAALDAPQFIQAEKDVSAGRVTRDTQLFYWSNSADAPPPAESDSYFMLLPQPSKTEFWQWSAKAGHYYWTRWPGVGPNGEVTHLPQYNWSSNAWPQEASRAAALWMGTGLDGMVVDAVNWYVGFSWSRSNEFIKAFHTSPGAKLLLPEGGGAFHDDPTGWIRDGGWNAFYDYGIDIPWDKNHRPMLQSIQDGNPALYERALREFHDRVIAAGGTLVAYVPYFKNPQIQQFAEELIATSGFLPCYCGFSEGKVTNHPFSPEVTELLKLKAHHPALYQNSLRRRIATDHDSEIYATLRYAADNSERLLVVFNFSQKPVDFQVDTRAIYGNRYEDLESSDMQYPHGGTMRLKLAGYRHRIFRVILDSAPDTEQYK